SRRLRRSDPLRRMVRETELSPDDLIYPIFVVEGRAVRRPIPSMPGILNLSIDQAVEEARHAKSAGIPAIILFGIPAHKDARGKVTNNSETVIQRVIQAIKEALPVLQLVADVCLCEYTDHGHCGLIQGQEVHNDSTLPMLAQAAVAYARAGADIIAPSDMM